MVSETSYVVILAVSSSISVICSLVIISTFVFQREIRTVTRHIIICISIADFFTALSYLCSLSFKNIIPTTISAGHMCVLQSFVSSTSSLCSFLWTMSFSIALFWILKKGNVDSIQRKLPFFHMVCWLIPLIINVTALCLHKLGWDNNTGTGRWCWIVNDGINDKQFNEIIAWMFIDGKGIEIFTYVVIFVLSIFIQSHLKEKIRKSSCSTSSLSPIGVEDRNLKSMKLLCKKLFFIPILFILIRIWGTVRFFIYVANPQPYTEKPNGIHSLLKILQIIGDSSQSTVNMLLFCISTPKIRRAFVVKLKSYFSYLPHCCTDESQGNEGMVNRHLNSDSNEHTNLLHSQSSDYESFNDIDVKE